MPWVKRLSSPTLIRAIAWPRMRWNRGLWSIVVLSRKSGERKERITTTVSSLGHLTALANSMANTHLST